MSNLFLLFSFCFLNKPLNDSAKESYILRISWKDDFHGRLYSTWILKESKNDLTKFETLKPNGNIYKMIPLIVPMSSLDYMACCEMKNSDAFNSTLGRKFFDSLGEKYNKKYDKYYFQGRQIFNKKSSFNLTKDTLKEFKIQFYKVIADFCICKAAYSNPGSSYTDTVGHVNNIYKYETIGKNDRKKLKMILSEVFSKEMVQDTLEFYRIPSK